MGRDRTQFGGLTHRIVLYGPRPLRCELYPCSSKEVNIGSLTDPDAPSRQDQKLSPILHYLVGNIPGHDVNKGHVIVDYLGAQPPKDAGV